ncbi:hypothetical protein AGABI2DRAFT_191794 [Agaricus bisporus var. bisporus H97]|uniref:hypothetical protein n=1 Tax=Agaricus bisporus var. bisporus (strain H97 / ATCC MYA-4626 / FGSC 10389) TaxID=936046 RepID=UPI00029F6466|nr:hypothetical protein AGABI2DRAFT_191794 [Agaricus bisporus var. bisporus H97]EKV48158.1 hypothetical protein AGABI2DRAFT_191794 [Agaricus bisporus var. bisporus H97]
MNNAYLVLSLGSSLDPETTLLAPPSSPKDRIPSELCLPERLPTMSFLQREAIDSAPKAYLRSLRHSPPSSPASSLSQEDLTEPTTPETPNQERRLSIGSIVSAVSVKSTLNNLLKPTSPKLSTTTGNQLSRLPEPFEVLRAVEHHDITFLMNLRDRAFHLLLRNSGNTTPLIHAIRLGYKDVSIILLGAFSRWINNLEDEDIQKPSTITLLKALRINLKLAIDEGLAKHQSDLISSFMQTLIMSEGDKWVWSQVNTIALALNAGEEGRPVALAGSVVRSFATKRLGKADLIASLEDYIANATADLLMMSAWSNVLKYIEGENIPSYYFARDLRVYSAFQERLDRHRHEVRRLPSKQLKWQLRVLSAVMEGRTITFRAKVEMLGSQLDHREV